MKMRLLLGAFLIISGSIVADPVFDFTCKREMQSCPCISSKGAIYGGFCTEGSNGLTCRCNYDTYSDDELLALQKKRFEDAPARTFGVSEDGSTEIGERNKALLREKLNNKEITYYSNEIPYGARIPTDDACSTPGVEYVCEALRQLVLDGKVGRRYATLESMLPPRWMYSVITQALETVCTEIHSGRFLGSPAQLENAYKKGPCARFIYLLENNRTRSGGIKLTSKEKQLIMDICARKVVDEHGLSAQTKRNNDPCRCANGQLGVCAVDKNAALGLWCHCE